MIIGETIAGRRSVTAGLFSAILGSVVYRMFIALALKVELFPSYGLKLVSALIVALAGILSTLFGQAERRAEQERRDQRRSRRSQ